MKKLAKMLPIILVISVVAVSCNLPFQQIETPAGDVPPNLTLTALFDTSLHSPPTITPAVNGATPVELPTVNIPTEVPTSTQIATLIPPKATLVPSQRGGNQMKAGFLSTAPVMDGTYAEWVDSTFKYNLPYVVWGASNWNGAADLGGEYAAAWDDTYLYLSVKVTDDQFVQNLSGKMLYEGDSVEILVDTNLLGDFYVQSLDGDDFQLGISPGNPAKSIAKEAYLWYPDIYAGTKTSILVSSLFETGPIYRVEAGIPWSFLGITPTNGMRLGFAVSINDNDNISDNIQQTMISTAQYRDFLDPTTWGELILVK